MITTINPQTSEQISKLKIALLQVNQILAKADDDEWLSVKKHDFDVFNELAYCLLPIAYLFGLLLLKNKPTKTIILNEINYYYIRKKSLVNTKNLIQSKIQKLQGDL